MNNWRRFKNRSRAEPTSTVLYSICSGFGIMEKNPWLYRKFPPQPLLLPGEIWGKFRLLLFSLMFAEQIIMRWRRQDGGWQWRSFWHNTIVSLVLPALIASNYRALNQQSNCQPNERRSPYKSTKKPCFLSLRWQHTTYKVVTAKSTCPLSNNSQEKLDFSRFRYTIMLCFPYNI